MNLKIIKTSLELAILAADGKSDNPQRDMIQEQAELIQIFQLQTTLNEKLRAQHYHAHSTDH